ncbi:hypothetical protein ACWEQ1_34270 [Streptomyces nodosus]
MAVTELLVADEIMTRLSDKARQEVALNLHKRDCQTCGAPLGEQTPALVVDDCGPFLSATLNHENCRPSGWYELRSLMAGAHLSWTSRFFTLPMDEGNGRPPRYLFRGSAMGPPAFGSGMTSPPLVVHDPGGGVTGSRRHRRTADEGLEHWLHPSRKSSP